MTPLGRSVVVALAAAVSIPDLTVAQGVSPPPGRAHLFVLDLSGTPVGEFPTTIKQLKGSMEVALKDGVPMLKASVSSEFLITLPQGQVLPADFTLEFDLVPKACCAPQDLSFEGTPGINQGAGSAHVLWDSDGHLAIVGGGGTNQYEAPMPEDLRATLPGVLTNVVAVVQGPTIRLYTNGRRHYTMDRNFARGRVLRVFLGVDPGRQDPVYLAGLRIVAGAHPPTGVAINPTPPPGRPGATTPVLVNTPIGSITPGRPASTPAPIIPRPPVPPPAQPPQPPTAPSPPTPAPATMTVSVVMGPTGPVVSWTALPNATGYRVGRSKLDDANCCNTSSGRTWATTSPWRDQPLPMAGSYVYQVFAQTPTGTIGAQTQFDHAPPGAAAPITPVLVSSPTGSITPMPAPAPSPPPSPVTVLPAVSPPASITPMAPPPQPPTVPAPSGRVPLAGGASTITPAGPATLTVANRSGWGATIQWSEVVNAAGYQIDRSVAGGAFMLFAGVDAKFQPAVSGFHSSEDVTVQPGIKYEYQVKALFATGPAYSAYSTSAAYDAPNSLALPSNLTATLSAPFKAAPKSTAPPLRTVTWSWQGIPGALTYEAEISLIDVLPSSAQQVIGVTRVTLPADATPPYSTSVETGKRVQFCLSLIRPTAAQPHRYGSCRTTDVVP